MLSDGSTSMSSLALLTLALALVALQDVIEDIEQWCRIVQGKCEFPCDKWVIGPSVNWNFHKNSISSFGLHSVASYTQGMHTPNKYPYYYLPIITSSILDLSKMFYCFRAPVTSTLLLTPPAGMCAPTLPQLLLLIYNHQMLSLSLYHQTLFPTPSIDNGRKNHLWSTHI